MFFFLINKLQLKKIYICQDWYRRL